MEKDILNLEEACEFLNVSERTLIKLLREERLPARKTGGEWRFSKQTLINWSSSGNYCDYSAQADADAVEMNMIEQKFCQSCGMPLETEEALGTNANQSKNADYCVYCFKDGEFARDVTMEEMINISMEHMKEMFASDPNFDAQEALSKMRSFFPELKRWKV